MRKCNNWLQTWLEYSSAWEAPERFRLWSGIAAISAVAQRRLFTFVKGQRLYANTYILLIGSPGSGKGNAMKYLAQWLKLMDGETFKIAPDGLTQRAFYMTLEQALQVPSGPESEQHSLSAFIEELGVFLRPGDNEFVYSLCHIYDCPQKFHYKTASAGENFANNSSFSMLSACTPKALRDIFSEDAMELGISARTIIIFADEKVEVPIFGKRKQDEKAKKDLTYDLDRMLELPGAEYQFDSDAAQALVNWSSGGFPPVPKDPRFEHYNSRRFVQIVKLCMIFALSKRDDPVILLEDFNEVKSIILEAERYMPKAIETLGANPLLAQQQAALKYVNMIHLKFNRHTEEHELIDQLSRDVAPHLIKDLIDGVSNAKWVTAIGTAPNRKFFPRGKEEKQE